MHMVELIKYTVPENAAAAYCIWLDSKFHHKYKTPLLKHHNFPSNSFEPVHHKAISPVTKCYLYLYFITPRFVIVILHQEWQTFEPVPISIHFSISFFCDKSTRCNFNMCNFLGGAWIAFLMHLATCSSKQRDN